MHAGGGIGLSACSSSWKWEGEGSFRVQFPVSARSSHFSDQRSLSRADNTPMGIRAGKLCLYRGVMRSGKKNRRTKYSSKKVKKKKGRVGQWCFRVTTLTE